MPTPVIFPTYTIGSWAANVDDDQGCRWVIEPGGADSLTGGVGRKTHTVERPFGPGAYRSRSYLTARTAVLQGWCDAGVSGRAGRIAARDRLMALFVDGGTALLTVDDGISPRQLTVELGTDDPKCAVWPDGNGFDWQISLYAADPRFLSTEVLSAAALPPSASTDGLDWTLGSPGGLDWAAGSPGGLDWGTSGTGVNILALNNPGTAPTWPVLTFTTTTTLTNPALQDPLSGAILSYLGSINSGQTLVIDTSPFTRSVTLDGVDRLGAMGLVGWPEIEPGSTLNLQFTGTGTGTVVAEWQAAYL